MSFERPSFENPQETKSEVAKPKAEENKSEKKLDEKERLGMERRLNEFNRQLENLKKGLKSMEGTPGSQPITNPDDPNRSEMRKILDREHELNSAQSPIDAKDPNRRTEYQDWLNALEDGKRATKQLKASLEHRIEDRKTEISKLEEEKRKIEEQIQRG